MDQQHKTKVVVCIAVREEPFICEVYGKITGWDIDELETWLKDSDGEWPDDLPERAATLAGYVATDSGDPDVGIPSYQYIEWITPYECEIMPEDEPITDEDIPF